MYREIGQMRSGDYMIHVIISLIIQLGVHWASVPVQNIAGRNYWSLGRGWSTGEEAIHRCEKWDWRCKHYVLMEWTYILWAQECRKYLVFFKSFEVKRRNWAGENIYSCPRQRLFQRYRCRLLWLRHFVHLFYGKPFTYASMGSPL